MSIQDISNYVRQSPNNTNPNVVRSMTEGVLYEHTEEVANIVTSRLGDEKKIGQIVETKIIIPETYISELELWGSDGTHGAYLYYDVRPEIYSDQKYLVVINGEEYLIQAKYDDLYYGTRVFLEGPNFRLSIYKGVGSGDDYPWTCSISCYQSSVVFEVKQEKVSTILPKFLPLEMTNDKYGRTTIDPKHIPSAAQIGYMGDFDPLELFSGATFELDKESMTVLECCYDNFTPVVLVFGESSVYDGERYQFINLQPRFYQTNLGMVFDGTNTIVQEDGPISVYHLALLVVEGWALGSAYKLYDIELPEDVFQ